MDEIAGTQPGHLRHHHGQERIRGDVERYAKKDIRAALIKLARKTPLRDIELKQGVAGRKRHAVDIRHVPGTHDVAPRIGIGTDGLHHGRYLVDVPPVRRGPAPPLITVDGPQVAFGRGPFVPDGHSVFVQVADIGIPREEPQQFVDDGAQMELLGSEQWETLGQVETHLVAEDTLRPRPRPVALHGSLLHDFIEQFEILAHRFSSKGNAFFRSRRTSAKRTLLLRSAADMGKRYNLARPTQHNHPSRSPTFDINRTQCIILHKLNIINWGGVFQTLCKFNCF